MLRAGVLHYSAELILIADDICIFDYISATVAGLNIWLEGLYSLSELVLLLSQLLPLGDVGHLVRGVALGVSESQFAVCCLCNDGPVFGDIWVTKVPLSHDEDGLIGLHVEGLKLTRSVVKFSEILISLAIDLMCRLASSTFFAKIGAEAVLPGVSCQVDRLSDLGVKSEDVPSALFAPDAWVGVVGVVIELEEPCRVPVTDIETYLGLLELSMVVFNRHVEYALVSRFMVDFELELLGPCVAVIGPSSEVDFVAPRVPHLDKSRSIAELYGCQNCVGMVVDEAILVRLTSAVRGFEGSSENDRVDRVMVKDRLPQLINCHLTVFDGLLGCSCHDVCCLVGLTVLDVMVVSSELGNSFLYE